MKTINLKENDYSVMQALFFMEQEIELCKLEHIPMFKIITGYGSHGKGGLIKVEALKRLKWLKKTQKITDFIDGGLFNMQNKTALNYVLDNPLIEDEDFNKSNSGVIIIIV